MLSTNSPLESLTAFAIVFTAGVLFTTGLALYTKTLKRIVQTSGPTPSA